MNEEEIRALKELEYDLKEHKTKYAKNYEDVCYNSLIKLQQENRQLKRMLNIKEELDKKGIAYEWDFKDMFDTREENNTLKQQLKDKDEKISKAIEYIKQNKCDTWYYVDKNRKLHRRDDELLEILESNKED